MRQGDRDIDWHKAYIKLKIRFDETSNMLEEQNKKIDALHVAMWRFCAYKTKKDYESGEHYFVKYFLDHTEMKVFSAKHSAKEKLQHSGYCSMYWKIDTNSI